MAWASLGGSDGSSKKCLAAATQGPTKGLVALFPHRVLPFVAFPYHASQDLRRHGATAETSGPLWMLSL
ncbi:hypothetical protein HaLaN_05802 [Haematococcus lacustris]|uniref:Uncharacterized protein n=1 Tax=Haematococcus lacustris TaxID=44745 RepID=A0A699YLU3_HAELA|nr:hypothetical protein HaLaN_05802 [Haematococcus lacustris]